MPWIIAFFRRFYSEIMILRVFSEAEGKYRLRFIRNNGGTYINECLSCQELKARLLQVAALLELEEFPAFIPLVAFCVFELRHDNKVCTALLEVFRHTKERQKLTKWLNLKVDRGTDGKLVVWIWAEEAFKRDSLEISMALYPYLLSVAWFMQPDEVEDYRKVIELEIKRHRMSTNDSEIIGMLEAASDELEARQPH